MLVSGRVLLFTRAKLCRTTGHWAGFWQVYRHESVRSWRRAPVMASGVKLRVGHGESGGFIAMSHEQINAFGKVFATDPVTYDLRFPGISFISIIFGRLVKYHHCIIALQCERVYNSFLFQKCSIFWQDVCSFGELMISLIWNRPAAIHVWYIYFLLIYHTNQPFM